MRPSLLMFSRLPIAVELVYIFGGPGQARNMHDAFPCPLSVLSPHFCFAAPLRVALSQLGLMITT
jgi:hypothetical protein